uniref:Cytochrome c oxidase assembly protein COX11, mitochondrial n=1 Tax=Eptatretus burgeri TaxID=7764 RepID=A0A8C4Q975_EPTBU
MLARRFSRCLRLESHHQICLQNRGKPNPGDHSSARPCLDHREAFVQSALGCLMALLAALRHFPLPCRKAPLLNTWLWCGRHVVQRSTHGTPRSAGGEARRRNITVLTYIAAGAIGMLGLSYAAVPLYRLYCQVVPGETALAFYKAKNPTDEPIIGISTYNVLPLDAAQYFNKIQCFCFEEQWLNSGEEVDLPVFFYIDPDFVDDPRLIGVDTITLSYTFFQARQGHVPTLPGFHGTGPGSKE